MAGRTVRRFVSDLGYVVHTPSSVFGRTRLEEGLEDEDWLPVVGTAGWVVFGRDQHILVRERELKAYLDANVHLFLLPGKATRQQILELLTINLANIGALAVARRPDVYWLTPARRRRLPTRTTDLARKRRQRRM